MISSHHLPGPAFEALCAGRADLVGLSVLRTAQLSKHLLLLRLVYDRLPPRSPHLRPSGAATRALELLAEVRDRQRPAFDEVFGYPYVAAGLVHSLRQLRGGHDPAPAVSFLAAVALTVAVRAGRDATLDGVPAVGPVHLPTLGTVEAPSGGGPLRLATAGGVVRIGARTVDLTMPAADPPGWAGVRPLAAGSGRQPVFDDVDPHRESGGLRASGRVSALEFAGWRDGYAEAMALLRERHPARAAQIGEVLRAVTPLDALRPGQGRSASAWQAYGAVAATVPGDALSYAATLIHETQHSVLNAILDLVELYDRTDQSLYYSPWRADPRPLRGLVHGCYAFLGVADFWARECAGAGRSPRAEFEFGRASVQLRAALATLRAVPSLTADGRHLVSGIARSLDAIGAGFRAEPASHLADLVADDHRLSWRLRVLEPDPAVVAACADAWRAGRRAPATPDSPVARAATDTFVPNSRIRRLSSLARQEGDVPGDDADDQLIARNYEAAAKVFADEVRAGGADAAVWTGLALAGSRLGGPGASAWQHRPELVRAVYQALSGSSAQPPDPLSLAGWLAEGLGG